MRLGRSKAVMPAVIGILSLAFWLPYAVRAGFLYDDWATVAGYKFHTSLFVSYRPGFVLWKAIVVRLFQTDPLGYYVSLAVLLSAMVVMAVVALNELGVPPVLSAGVGLLLLVSPYADSLGLWWTASQMTLAMLLAVSSIAAGARWIHRRPHAGIYLGASLALLVAGIVTYEAVAPIVLLPAVLICFSHERSRVLRWVVAAGVTAAVASLYMFERAITPHHKSARPVAQYPARIWVIISNGTRVIVHHISSFLSYKDALVAGIVAAASYGAWQLMRRRPQKDDVTWQWRLASALMLMACTYVAWIPFIPANDYYNPGRFGIGNRVNLLAQLFLLTAVVLVLAALAKIASGRVLPAVVGVVIAAGVFGGLLATYASQTHQDQQEYLSAKSTRQAIMTEVKQLLPRVTDGDEILLGDYHLTSSLQWVPVLSASWDTTGALDMLYDNGTITAQPVSSALGCARNGLRQPSLEAVTRVPYRRIIVVDVSGHRLERMADESQCRVELVTLAPNPNPF